MKAPAPAAASLDLLDPRLIPLCEAYLRAAQVPGASIAVVLGDRGYHHAFGVKSILTREAVTSDTAFNIGSCTKAFVSATLASLVADALVSWDDPISAWVPEFELHDPAVTAQVTLRDLGANRLGLPRVGLVDAGIAPDVPVETLLRGLRHTAPVARLRERFTYVNAGHVANALAIGRITGLGFLATLRERVLTPLSMHQTSGGAATPADLPDRCAWHALVAGSVVAIDDFYSDQRLGSGGLYVSGRDALQWLRLHLNGGRVDGCQVIAREALLETHRPHTVARPGQDILSLFYPGARMAAYGLGWAVSDLDGHPLVCHSGVDYGAGAMTLLLPEQGIGIAVYGNLQKEGPVPTAYALAAALLGLPPRDWQAYFEAAAPRPWAAVTEAPAAPAPDPAPALVDARVYAGRYTHPADGTMLIQADGDTLHGRCLRGHRMVFTGTAAGGHRYALHFNAPEWQQATALNPPLLQFHVAGGRATAAELFMGPIGRRYYRER